MRLLCVVQIPLSGIEAFVTHCAFESRRQSISVDSCLVLSPFASLLKLLCAIFARKPLDSEVHALDVVVPNGFPSEPAAAPAALIRFESVVHPLMFLQRVLREKGLGAHLALMLSDLFVDVLDVLVQTALRCISDVLWEALCALVRVADSMDIVHVLLPSLFELEGLCAARVGAQKQVIALFAGSLVLSAVRLFEEGATAFGAPKVDLLVVDVAHMGVEIAVLCVGFVTFRTRKRLLVVVLFEALSFEHGRAGKWFVAVVASEGHSGHCARARGVAVRGNRFLGVGIEAALVAILVLLRSLRSTNDGRILR